MELGCNRRKYMFISGKNEYISRSRFQLVKSNQIGVYASQDCGEAIIVENDPFVKFGVQTYLVQYEDLSQLESKIREMGLNKEIVFLKKNEQISKCYVAMECVLNLSKRPSGLSVEECGSRGKKHLKIYKVFMVSSLKTNETECSQ